MEQQHGILVLDKPQGLSSAQCSNRLKRLGQKKVGHAGTLDPMASGVLLVLLGQATKISAYLNDGGGKTYLATICLGKETDTWDAWGTVVAEKPWENLTETQIRQEIANFLGSSQQTVPPYSAAKHEGKPLYKLARAGLDVPVKIKTIEISQAEVLRVELPFVHCRITCSSGTYIRSLAHSLGMRLGSGAMLSELVREYSHPFHLSQASNLSDILDNPSLLPQRVLPLTTVLPWPSIELSPAEEADIRNGLPILARENFDQAICLDTKGFPLALVQIKEASQVWTIVRGLWIN